MAIRPEASEARELPPRHDTEPVVDYSPEGVDRTLIYEMLRLTPAERLEKLQGFVDSVWAIRYGAPGPS